MENKIKEYEHQLEQNGYEKSSIIQIRAVIGGFFRDSELPHTVKVCGFC